MTAERLETLLDAAAVDPAVHELRPDYVALLVAADGLRGGPSDEASDGWLREAEAAVTVGAKPQRTRNSLGARRPRDRVRRRRRPGAPLRAFDHDVATARRLLTAPPA